MGTRVLAPPGPPEGGGRRSILREAASPLARRFEVS